MAKGNTKQHQKRTGPRSMRLGRVYFCMGCGRYRWRDGDEEHTSFTNPKPATKAQGGPCAHCRRA